MVQKIVTFNVALKSTERQWVQKVPEVYTNDLGSVSIQFNITDCTDAELTGSSAIVLLKMRDGSFFQGTAADVSRTLNVFSYTLKENEGNHDGLAEIQLIVSIAGKDFGTQKYQFKVNAGLDSEVAREIMIYDWTTLTAEARAYIAQFTADELVRDAEFDNNEFDRNTTFVASQDARTLAFGTEQTNRGTAFTAEQNERTTAFNESESGRTTAESGRVTAESNRVTAESGRVTKESQRVTAESSRVTAESGRVTAESGRVTAESGRVTAETNRATAFTAFDTRLTAEETATANNKISAVKGKTFSDVDARIEDVELDTTLMATNLVSNGDFSNGTTGWTHLTSGTISASENILTEISSSSSAFNRVSQITPVVPIAGNKIYTKARAKSASELAHSLSVRFDGSSASGTFQQMDIAVTPLLNTWYEKSGIITIPSDMTGFLRVSLQHRTTIASAGQYAYWQRAIVIDLTATFGKGNEPTAEQMDRLLTQFPNSWFDGTENLFLAKLALSELRRLDNEKANKVQEAWITPTLTNGWVVDDGYTVGYCKDEFGNVKIKGRLKSGSLSVPILTLPLAYRPAQTTWFPCICGGVVLGNISINTSGAVTLWSGNNTYTTLDTINFRV